MVRGLQTRSHREKSGLFLIEGTKLVAEALSKGVQITDVLVSQAFLKERLKELQTANITEISTVDDRRFCQLVTTEGPCGIVAIARMPRCEEGDLIACQAPLVVIAEAIQDPGNLGTMIRTALAARASGMILTKGTVDRFNPKVVRAAAGALFMLPILAEIASAQALDFVRKHRLTVIACEPTARTLYWETDMTGPTALVFGNEGQGFSPPVLTQSTQTVAIPMNDCSESLNVAVAAGVILFGAAEQRLKAASATGKR